MRRTGIAATLFVCLPVFSQHGSTTVVNPYTGPEHAQAGASLYRAQCAGCHGPTGKGTGAGPTLTAGTFQHGGSDEALFQTISKGLPGTSMPGFKFTGLQIWQLVTHVRAMGAIESANRAKGDPKAGAQIFAASCSRCHAVHGQGGSAGPDLTAAGSRLSYTDLHKAITDPNAEARSAYWSVIAKKADGETIRGVRLNEDTHSVQIRTDTGRLVSLLKQDVSDFKVIRQSPMPSFAGKLQESQIADVVSYLAGLKGEQ